MIRVDDDGDDCDDDDDDDDDVADDATERMSPRFCHRPGPPFLRPPGHQVKSQFFPVSLVSDTTHNDDETAIVKKACSQKLPVSSFKSSQSLRNQPCASTDQHRPIFHSSLKVVDLGSSSNKPTNVTTQRNSYHMKERAH